MTWCTCAPQGSEFVRRGGAPRGAGTGRARHLRRVELAGKGLWACGWGRQRARSSVRAYRHDARESVTRLS
eukprot:11877436-Alexandrium_andersonii.AAC.1